MREQRAKSSYSGGLSPADLGKLGPARQLTLTMPDGQSLGFIDRLNQMGPVMIKEEKSGSRFIYISTGC